jgi:hypothetical protein
MSRVSIASKLFRRSFSARHICGYHFPLATSALLHRPIPFTLRIANNRRQFSSAQDNHFHKSSDIYLESLLDCLDGLGDELEMKGWDVVLAVHESNTVWRAYT